MHSTDELVYNWFYRNSDDDGMVEESCPSVANRLKMPVRTIQGAMARLERQNKVFLVGYRKWVVVEKAE